MGKLLPDDLYVHRSALDHLEPLLRVYEGCGRAYLGEVEGANLIKIHRRSGKLSYLVYPEFDDDPHPVLLRSIRVNLRTRQIDSNDYAQSTNPPVLHRKETFLAGDHPLRAKFARLTAQEEKHGLLDDTSTIGTQRGLANAVGRAGVCGEGAPAGEGQHTRIYPIVGNFRAIAIVNRTGAGGHASKRAGSTRSRIIGVLSALY